MPRYVLLRHECDHLPAGSHWDFMLEHNSVLLTWAVAQLPQPWAEALGKGSSSATQVPAKQLPDHRQHYLSYEGPVSGNRGTVTRVAAGTYTLIGQCESNVAWRFETGSFSGHASAQQLEADRWRLTVTP